MEQHTRARVHIGVGVLGLSMLLQHLRRNAAVLLHKLEDWVGGDLGAGSSVVHQGLEAWVRLTEHGVAVTRHDTAAVEGGPEVVVDVVFGVVSGDGLLHLDDPAEDFLGGEAVEGAGETLETGAVAKKGVAQCATNQVGGMGRNVTAFVVTVEGEVETEEVLEVLVLLAALAEHGGEVVGPILLEVDLGGKSTATLVGVLVDLGRDSGQFGEKRDAVVKGRLPVIGLVEALLVRLGKLGCVVQGGNSNGKLGHWVEVLGEVVKQLGDKVWELALLGELTRELAGLVDRGHFASKQKPEHGLGKHLGAGLALGQLLLAVLDGAAVEANTLVGIEHGTLPYHGLEAAHTTNCVLNLDLANDLGAVGLDLLEQLALGRDHLLERCLEVGFGGRVCSSCNWGISNWRGSKRLQKCQQT